MQEDIEYLKDICNIVKSDPINTITLNSATRYHLARAIETVLADRERLMNKLEMFSKQNIEYSKTLENLQKNTIWKDKIRAKLEELRDIEQELSDEQGYWGSADILAQIDILEELLGEE